ncbi:hypothetical protein BU24DRAFT_65722 [Aaosphaeria arxii CBS 175.79]|uniref:Uncharacterized protein n=1 Tax=Aaosphaeria arxii CBS 175.79 TaxID=1450172 RepID=A0A6A5XAA5_9PLEO|nr:uncharacterized protein BU24DRAFT_65722 [Aaosphaeria arxii CBS 175.79]KAF2009850.1 hypothetical protein BU24DRAFT_65722 [Aaosphaeria arxii CBS 175.79]
MVHCQRFAREWLEGGLTPSGLSASWDSSPITASPHPPILSRITPGRPNRLSCLRMAASSSTPYFIVHAFCLPCCTVSVPSLLNVLLATRSTRGSHHAGFMAIDGCMMDGRNGIAEAMSSPGARCGANPPSRVSAVLFLVSRCSLPSSYQCFRCDWPPKRTPELYRASWTPPRGMQHLWLARFWQ